MNYKLITVSAFAPEHGEQELNTFLNSHKIVSVEKKCSQSEQGIFWSFAICYLGTDQKSDEKKRASVDYKEVLSEDDFNIYARLRELRNSLAVAEGKPPYAIFTNEQLAKLVTEKVTTSTGMEKINGIGKARLQQYADTFLPLLQELHAREVR